MKQSFGGALLLGIILCGVFNHSSGYDRNNNNNNIPSRPSRGRNRYRNPYASNSIPKVNVNGVPDINHLQTNKVPDDETLLRQSREKVASLGTVLKTYVHNLRRTANRQVDLVFLVDSSASVAEENFKSELKFVRKLLADFTVDQNSTRVAVITFSSPSRVVREVDQISQPSETHHKCSILEEELPAIRYTGGGTFTLGAMLEAQV